MHDDAALLRRYVHERDHAAFAGLVHRHLALVYNAALRRTGGNAHQAAEIAQHVFTALAQKASRLSAETVLAAWLHTATRNAAIKLMISDQRRRVREARALELAAIDASDAATNWEQLRPLLDGAIDELAELDRATIILRFFEHRAFAEIGAKLRVSEDAARMRTDRALERLRGALARRGISSTAAAVGVLVANQPAVAAPAGLAASISAHSLAAAGATGGIATVTTFMSTKTVSLAALSATLAFFIGTHVGRRTPVAAVDAPTETVAAARTIAALREDNQRLQARLSGAADELARLKETNAQLTAERTAATSATANTTANTTAAPRRSPTMGMLRYEVQTAVLNNLRQISAAADQYRLERGRPAASVQELVGRGHEHFIKTLRTVGGEDYADLKLDGSEPLTVITPDGVSVTYDPVGDKTTKPDFPPEVARMQELGRKVRPTVEKAMAAYRAAHNGGSPADNEALVPYFASPQEGADFVEFLQARKTNGNP